MPSLYWYRTETNFGDAFSPMAVRYCFGTTVCPAGKWSADLVAEGSVLGFTLFRDMLDLNPFQKGILATRAFANRILRRPLTVWGSGLMFPINAPRSKVMIRRPQFFALRGERTRQELIAAGMLDRGCEVALGDPGIFMPEVLGLCSRQQGPLGFVVHAFHWQSGFVEAYHREHPEIRLIDPRQSPKVVASEIAGCSAIYSSSLHGLVVADALGIPNRWVALETPYATRLLNRFKFDDYYSAFGIRREPCTIREISEAPVYDPISQDALRSAKKALKDSAVGSLAGISEEGVRKEQK